VGRWDVACAAVCSRFHATRAPAKQAHGIAFHAAAHPDHLRSEGTGSSGHRYQPIPLPAHAPGQGDCRGSSQLLSADVADAVRPTSLSLSEQADGRDGSSAISTDIRETLAQLGPEVFAQAGSSSRLASKPQHNFAQTRPEKRRRSARHPSFDTTLEWCDSMSHRRDSCRYAITHPRTHTPGQF